MTYHPLENVQRLGSIVHWTRDGHDHMATERQVRFAYNARKARLNGCPVDDADLVTLTNAFTLAQGYPCRRCSTNPVADTNADDLCRGCEDVVQAASDTAMRSVRSAS